MTHDRLSREKSSARPMDGSATLTMLASRTTTNCAAASRASASQRRSWGVLKALLLGRIGHDPEGEFRFPIARYGVDVPFVKPYIRHVTNIAHRPLRADARRNRERVIAAARQVFGEQG